MGEHIDIRSPRKKKKLKEHDPNARHARVTFKRYLQSLEEDLLDTDEQIDGELISPDLTQDE
jgi:hypothetical protein